MPNHVTQRIEISGNKKQLEEFAKVLKNGIEKDGDCYNYNFCDIFIPQPEELNRTIATTETFTAQKELKANFKIASLLKQHKTYVALFEKCGYTNWYDWALDNWGTKWGSYDAIAPIYAENGTITVQFKSAWTPIIKCLINISKSYPKLKFNIIWADESLGRCFREPSDESEKNVNLRTC